MARRTRRACALGLILILLWSLPVSTIGGQERGPVEPDGSGQVNVTGPPFWDVAFKIDGPRAAAPFSAPAIVNGTIFILEDFNLNDPFQPIQNPVIWRIDTDTAVAQRWTELGDEGGTASALTTDGSALYFAGRTTFRQLWPGNGTFGWSTAFPAPQGFVPFATSCAPPVVTTPSIILACSSMARPLAGTTPGGVSGVVAPLYEYDFVMSLDRATGQAEWRRMRALRDVTNQGSAPDAITPQPGRPFFGTGPHQVVVSDQSIVVSIVDRTPPEQAPPCVQASTAASSIPLMQTVWALAPRDGATQWEWRAPVPPGRGRDAINLPNIAARIGELDEVLRTPLALLLLDGRVLVKGQELYVLDARTGCLSRQLALAYDYTSLATNPSLLAAGDDTLFVGSFREIFALDPATLETKWKRSFLQGPEYLRPEQQAIVVQDRLVVSALTAGSLDPLSAAPGSFKGRVVAISTHNGSVLWSHEFNPFSYAGHLRSIGVGHDLLVVDAAEGALLVVGRAGASIRIQANLSDTLVGANEAVRLDLRGSRPGVQDPDFEVMVDWGDNITTAWESKMAEASHVYGAPGSYEVLVRARNAAGQASTERLLIVVEGPTAPKAGIWERLFSPERQEATFFVLGLFVTFTMAVGGLIFPKQKFMRRGRRR